MRESPILVARTPSVVNPAAIPSSTEHSRLPSVSAGSYLLHNPTILHDSLRELAEWLAQGKARASSVPLRIYSGCHAPAAVAISDLPDAPPHNEILAEQITVNVSHTFPMEEANRAFAALLNRDAIGKVLLVTGPVARL